MQTEQERRTRARNKTGSRGFRHLVVEKYGLDCFFCGVAMIDADMLPKKFWVEMHQGDGLLEWKTSKGEIHLTPFLTMEHLLPISHGGDTTPENVVPCCYSCNHRRNRLFNPPKKHLCVVCGKSRPRSRSMCDECATHKKVILRQLHDSWLLRVLSQGLTDAEIQTDCHVA